MALTFRLLLAGAAAFAIPAAGPAVATENKVVSCKTYLARDAGQQPGPALVANVPRSMTPIALNAVQLADKKLKRKVVVEGLYARRTPTDTLEVNARLVNCSKKPLQLELRSSFMDVNQFPTEKTSVWKPVFLPAYATAVYSEFSIGRGEVANYLVEMRQAN